MASEISLLVPEFRAKFVEAIQASKARGIQIEPIVTLLSVSEQSSMWKQGRTKVDVELKVLALANAGAHFLSNVLAAHPAQETNLVTEDLPGFSWHQWGEAATVVWIYAGKIVLSPKTNDKRENGYLVFAEECAKIGLTHGNTLTPAKFCYVQLRPNASVRDVYSVKEINAEMQKRYKR